MNNMIGYIFGSLHSSEKAISGIIKCLKSQSRVNKAFVLCSVIGAVNIVVLVDKCEQQQKAIEKLAKEIEELKEAKGEW